MSLNDEFKAAKKRMAAAKEAEKKKSKAPRRTSRAASEWSRESEIVAYYLYKADSSKFLRENYAKKRKVSARAMSMKINMFQELERGGKPKSESAHAQSIIDEYGNYPVDQLLKVAISIHRGEFNASTPTQSTPSTETPAEGAVIKRASSSEDTPASEATDSSTDDNDEASSTDEAETSPEAGASEEVNKDL